MPLQELLFPDGTPSGVRFCAQCRRPTETLTCAWCTCSQCAREKDHGRLICKTCIKLRSEASARKAAECDAARYAKAVKVPISEYKGEQVFIDVTGEYMGADDWEPEEDVRVYGTTPVRPRVHAGDVVEHLCDDMFDGAMSHISTANIKRLQDFLDAWTESSLPTTFYADYTTVVIYP